MQIVLQAIWFIAPLGAANICAAVFKNQWRALDRPIDSGKIFYGRRLFGDHKTWRGLIIGVLAGGIFFIIQQAVYVIPSFKYLSAYNYPSLPSYYGFIFGFGAMIGDLIRAFFKRRFGVAPGQRWLPFDQIDFIAGGLLFAGLFLKLDPMFIIICFVAGFALHIVVNHLGYFIGIKDSKW